uniref:Uncharacterized protein n=1 Tax=Scophthalmus maximus TaxID=52904 RepID=A0A8D3AII2_SCOMX
MPPQHFMSPLSLCPCVSQRLGNGQQFPQGADINQTVQKGYLPVICNSKSPAVVR